MDRVKNVLAGVITARVNYNDEVSYPGWSVCCVCFFWALYAHALVLTLELAFSSVSTHL